MITESLKQHLLESAAGPQWNSIGVRNHYGVVIPLFALHSDNSCGIGEFPDLIPLISWCREIGMDVIQLLPLNDTGLESSPYGALSAFALNPIHIGLKALPYIDENPDQELQKSITELYELNSSQRIDYKTVQKNKEGILKKYYQKYGDTITKGSTYKDFLIQQKAWLFDYAIFKVLKIHFNWEKWENWPESYQNPPEKLDSLPEEILKEANYHQFLQFLCFSQMGKVKQHAEEQAIYLKGDIPILINRESADVWRYRKLFLLNYAAGAPPDMYAPDGQKWGFPLYDWEALAAQNFIWWAERLKVASLFYHIYRLDHVVGFFRIWAVPISSKATEGHFFPEEKSTWIPQGTLLMHMMLRNSIMLPIGEDLGTIPPEVRDCLKSLGICSTKVMRWERRWNSDSSFIPVEDYIPESMTTVSTHDSETLAQWWHDHPEEAQTFAASMGWEYQTQITEQQRQAILRASHRSGSIFHINLLNEYLALIPGMTWDQFTDERINIPGTISDFNWSYRFRPSVEDIVKNSFLKDAIINLLK